MIAAIYARKSSVQIGSRQQQLEGLDGGRA